MKPLDSIEIAIRFIRAVGPVGANDIASELLTQCQWITSQNHAEIETSRVIHHGLHCGWLVRYDDEDSFVTA